MAIIAPAMRHYLFLITAPTQRNVIPMIALGYPKIIIAISVMHRTLTYKERLNSFFFLLSLFFFHLCSVVKAIPCRYKHPFLFQMNQPLQHTPG
jgi:hypothetical protein